MMEEAKNFNASSSSPSQEEHLRQQAQQSSSFSAPQAEDVSFARSQTVDLYQITLANDSAWPFLVELGTRARCVQFIDLNRSLQSYELPYTRQIKQCDDALNKVNFLITECKKAHIELQKPRDLEQFNSCIYKLTKQKNTSEQIIFDTIVKDVTEKHDFIKQQIGVIQEMIQNIKQLELFKTALITVDVVLKKKVQQHEHDTTGGCQRGDVEGQSMLQMTNLDDRDVTLQLDATTEEANLLLVQRDDQNQDLNAQRNTSEIQSGLNVIAGVCKEGETNQMTKLLYRVSRGKVISYFENIGTGIGQDLETNHDTGIGASQPISYAAYVLVFSDSDYLFDKVMRISQSFSINSYQIPKGQSNEERTEQVQRLQAEIRSSTDLLLQTRARLRDYLASTQLIDISISAAANGQSSPLAQLQDSSSSGQIDMLVLYQLFVEREKMIYLTLNKLRAEAGHLLLGFCWIPTRLADRALQTIRDVHDEDPNNLEMPRLFKLDPADYREEISPPTFIITNDFTWPFQVIVDLFDTPKYKEMNPALFTCVSFPFLFGVMFGDICHGSLLLLGGITLCYLKGRSSADSVDPDSTLANLFKVRHLILLLGIFSTYCGFLYNDFASIPLSLFGSCYSINGTTASQLPGCVSKTGLDPVWYLASNELAYVNSMKMKIAVILGVAHMTLGILLKGLNLVYFSRKIDFFFEFIPQLVILLALFGYMDFLIIVKWLTNWDGKEAVAPSIIQTMIQMFIGMGEIPVGTVPLLGENGRSQHTISLSLLVLTLVCIPTLLCCKPILLYKGSKESKVRKGKIEKDAAQFEGVQLVQKKSLKAKNSDDEDEEQELLVNNQNHSPQAEHESSPPNMVSLNFSGEANRESYLLKEDFAEKANIDDWRKEKSTVRSFHLPDITAQSPESQRLAQKPAKLLKLLKQVAKEEAGEDTAQHEEDDGFGILMIHQLIETIEFVLGTISNTASYLRLWALSLAHSQLASVFFDFTVKSGLDSSSYVGSVLMLWVGFMIFASVTLGVMMCMDVMECFLHTLRLHWVEFQSKFYQGGGQCFTPFVINEHLPLSLDCNGAAQRRQKLGKQQFELHESPKKTQ